MTISLRLPKIYLKKIEELVKSGRYTSRSEFLRIAVRDALFRERVFDEMMEGEG